MTRLLDDAAVVQRIFAHIDNHSTDLSEGVWREPVAHYRSPERFAAELELLRNGTTAFCPSAALPEPGSFVARDAAGTPILAVRGADGRVRAFRNACRHRGARVASGSGCEKAFVCRYHGWTYGLDGALRHVPHEHGFPGLDRETRGLVPLPTVEMHGLVFVTQGPPREEEPSLHELPPLIPPGRRLVQTTEQELPVNWKIFVESFLEGYHIRPTHRGTFYPVQFDNLNVVERFGRNSRVVFPYRAVHKLRDVAPGEISVDGKLTYVYHLFPNVMVATFPSFIFMIAIEPVAIDRTRFHTYITAAEEVAAAGANREDRADGASVAEAGAALIAAGAAEDNAVTRAVQEGLASGANEFLEFGRFEGAIGHFHRGLHAALAARGVAGTPAP
jgi:phenylpropionate dioxygenase-like ring-hydroxylating dioxygenase large terminal subunit